MLQPFAAACLTAGTVLAAAATASATTTVTVSSTAPTGAGSLGEAIAQVNAGAADRIAFGIGSPGSQQTIVVPDGTALPAITKPVLLDGRSQAGGPYTGPPLVRITGVDGGTRSAGLQLEPGAAGSTIRGVAVTRFTRSGIVVRAAGTTILGSFVGVGLAVDGRGNGGGGIVVDAANVTIGGPAATDANTIGDNLTVPESPRACGIDVVGGDGTLIAGNRIGATPDGMSGLGNAGTCGVRVGDGATGTTIGRTADGGGAANVIAKNGRNGVEVRGGTGTAIRGNRIGLAADGTADLGNTGVGVLVTGGSGTVVGGPDGGARNLISANSEGGVDVGPLAADVRVQGNIIGLAADGVSVRGNGTTAAGFGVRLAGSGAVVGGPTGVPGTGAGNVVSGNTGTGVLVTAGATADRLQGNLVGLGLDDSAQRNTGDGVALVGTAGGTLVGGPASTDRNVISGNDGAGVRLSGGQDTVQGNFVGTARDGTTSHGNATGVRLDGSGGVLGGAEAGAGNLVSGNDGDGVLVTSGAAGVAVLGNQVGGGVGALSTVAANFGAQVRVSGSAHDVRVGGPAAGEGNTVIDVTPAAETIRVDGTGAGVSVRGNRVPLFTRPLAWDVGAPGPTPAGAPVLDSVLTDGDRTQLFGTLSGALASTAYALDLYADPACTDSHRGAARYLGSASVTTDATGTATVNVPVDGAPAAGERLLAAATSLGGAGATGELGPCRSASPAPTLQMAQATASVSERDGQVLLTVARSGGGDGSASVRFRTIDGTAVAGTDYVARSNTAHVNADQTSVTVAIPVLRDGLAVGDKTFAVVLEAPNAAVLGRAQTTTVTVRDAPDPPAAAPVADPPGSAPAATPRSVVARTLPSGSVWRRPVRAIGGTTTVQGAAVARRVEVALSAASGCRRLHVGGRLRTDRRVRGACPPLYLRATGTARWRLALPRGLPAGRYVLRVRAVARSGLRSRVVRATIRVR